MSTIKRFKINRLTNYAGEGIVPSRIDWWTTPLTTQCFRAAITWLLGDAAFCPEDGYNGETTRVYQELGQGEGRRYLVTMYLEEVRAING